MNRSSHWRFTWGRTRGLLAVAAAAAVAVGTTVVVGTLASAQPGIDPDSYYQLISRHSGKAIQVQGDGSGAEVVQWTPHDGEDQQFRFVASGDGYYRLLARHSGMVLDVWEWNPDNGADIRQWPDMDGTNQQFELRESADGHVRLVNRFSGLALDVWGWSTADGARISQYTDHGGANQQWQLVPVTGATTPNPSPSASSTSASPAPSPSPSSSPSSSPSPSPSPSGDSCDGPPVGGEPVDPLPVTGNTWAHDPSLIRTPAGYVVFSTHNGVETRTSPDRAQWTRAAAAIPGGATWAGPYNDGDPDAIWAPDISFHDGTYWLYYSVSTFGSNRSAIGLATSNTGQPGSFADQGMVIDSAPGDNYNAIDPSLLVDADGGWWLAFGSFWSGIRMIRLDPATGMRHGQDQTVYSLASRPDTQIEGPAVVHRCGYYYLFVAWGLCCRGLDSTYEIRVGRSTSPTGPYLDRDGVDMLAGGGTEVLARHGRVVGPGGPDVLADGEGDLLVYHYYDGTANGAVRLGLNHLSWAGGWPALVP